LGNYWEKSLIWKRDWGFICWGKKEVICESWWLLLPPTFLPSNQTSLRLISYSMHLPRMIIASNSILSLMSITPCTFYQIISYKIELLPLSILFYKKQKLKYSKFNLKKI
jgi:hypothetical protein